MEDGEKERLQTDIARIKLALQHPNHPHSQSFDSDDDVESIESDDVIHINVKADDADDASVDFDPSQVGLCSD
jgi:hypothetical protein